VKLQLAFEQKTNKPITPSAEFSRAVLICGKRGSGKSYTLGVIAEELARLNRFLVILVDPMGVFWSMGLPTTTADGRPQTADSLTNGGRPSAVSGRERSELGGQRSAFVQCTNCGRERSEPAAVGGQFAVNILVPGDPAERYSAKALTRMQELGVRFSRITLDPAALSAQAWCDLFDLSMNEPLGICLYRAVRACQRKHGSAGAGEQGSGEAEERSPAPQPPGPSAPFSIRDLMREVEADGQAADRTREALLNRLDMAEQWGIFAEDGGLEASLKEDHINVLDLSIIDPGLYGLRNLLLALLCRDLFAQRIRARREEELGLRPLERRIWLLIDEAHQFVPTGRSSIAKDVLIRWVKEGRQPGLSLVAVSQQPGAIDADLLSQCDLLIIHKLTANEDLTAISRLGQSYIQGDLKVYLKRVREPGEVIIVDDHAERLWMGKVRERKTRHAGSELPLNDPRRLNDKPPADAIQPG